MYGIVNNKDTSHGRDQTFSYDALNRLTSAQNAGTNCAATVIGGKTEYWGNSYSYDTWGNLTNKSVTKCSAENFSVAALTNNQLSGYAYDAAGNMTHDLTSGLTYNFDQENRITGAAGYAYTYDGDGNRVRKSNGNMAANGTLYWAMTPGVVAETDLAGTTKSEYIFFDGERVARRDGATGTGGVFYYFSDHLKTASVITDSAGVIKAESDYYPWGGELQFVNNDSNDYKFTGKERDAETGNDLMGVRYYSSGLGRWTKPDPLPWLEWQHGDEEDRKKFDAWIANPQNLNLYTYVLNNPLNHTDPSGMNACGTKDDSSCKVTVTVTDRSKDKNGNYNDQYTGVKGQGNYNATASVTVNGKDAGTFLVKTTPSDSSSAATIANGTYSGTLTTHGNDIAIRLQPTNNIPTIGPNPSREDGASKATGILIHKAGIGNFTGVGRDGRAVSEGCQVICTSQFGAFKNATGMTPSAGPPQQHFTVILNTQENQPQ